MKRRLIWQTRYGNPHTPEGMARLPEVFHTGNMTFHEKEGARHEYRPTMEYIYNALPFFFPKNDE